jgi:hypothetical protein
MFFARTLLEQEWHEELYQDRSIHVVAQTVFSLYAVLGATQSRSIYRRTILAKDIQIGRPDALSRCRYLVNPFREVRLAPARINKDTESSTIFQAGTLIPLRPKHEAIFTAHDPTLQRLSETCNNDTHNR